MFFFWLFSTSFLFAFILCFSIVWLCENYIVEAEEEEEEGLYSILYSIINVSSRDWGLGFGLDSSSLSLFTEEDRGGKVASRICGIL